jgi:hypothetical protein
MNANPIRPATRKQQVVQEDPNQSQDMVQGKENPPYHYKNESATESDKIVFKRLAREYCAFYTLYTERINSPSKNKTTMPRGNLPGMLLVLGPYIV